MYRPSAPTRIRFQHLLVETRHRLGMSQAALASAVGVSRQYISAIETGRACPSLDEVDRIVDVLGIELELAFRPPLVLGDRQRDLVHARCVDQAYRRLGAHGWALERELEVVTGRSHGWIDLVAFDRRTGTLLVIEVKTRPDDLGAIERQLGWYERVAHDAARRLGWWPRRTVAWLLLLASDESERFVRANGRALDRAFPARAAEMMAGLADPAGLTRGLALVDPGSKRHDWLIRTRIDGRRSPLRYRGYADAATGRPRVVPGGKVRTAVRG